MEKDFKPYISHKENHPEFTALSVISGIFLAVVFGAANAYLGLKVGMTVSASIPAAVVAMGIMRAAGRKKSILESNLVQTMGSAGESLAAGAIFTLPALFMWAAGDYPIQPPSLLEITLITLMGGLLGVFFMVPLRKALIVNEHGTLPYPEGTACAEVLLAGEKAGNGAGVVFGGMGFAALVKIITDGFKLVSGEVNLRFRSFAGVIGTQIYPAVLSVGFICGPRISAYMFSGGVLAWLALIPLVVLSGGDAAEAYATGGAEAVWSGSVRYIGAGALAGGGVISLIKSLPLIVKTFTNSVKGLGSSEENNKRTEKSLNIKTVAIAIAVLIFLIWIIPAIPVTLGGAAIVAVFGFFFAAVSSRMVGLVGASNNPVSGMAIATLIVTAFLLKATGTTGARGMTAAIAIGSVISIVAAISGDTSQDLKTGFLLGATPKKQQLGEIVGVVAASLTIAGTMYLLDGAWGFGSEELAAPQAGLMKLIVEGVMENSLPWTLVLAGVFIAISAELSGIPVLPFAIGVYLPVQLSACIMAGGLIRLILEKLKDGERALSRGVLFCSGMIAGEGLAGVLLAVLTITGLGGATDFSERFNIPLVAQDIGGIVLFTAVILMLVRVSMGNRKRAS